MNETNPWPQNRATHRYKLEPALPVMIHTPQRAVAAQCRNIGLAGAGVTLSGQLPAGESVVLEIKLPMFIKALSIKAVVRHASETRCGLQFVELTPNQQKALEQFGAQHAMAAYVYSPDAAVVRNVQQVLQELGVSMVWRGSPSRLPVTDPHLYIIDSDWPDYVDVVQYLREESGESRLIVVGLFGSNVTNEDRKQVAADLVLHKPLTQGGLKRSLATAVRLLRV